MSVGSFLDGLRRDGITVKTENGQLRIEALPGRLTDDIRARLRARKNEILGFLQLAAGITQQQPALVPLQANGRGAPVFGLPGHNGDVFCFRWVAAAMGRDRPFFGLQPPGYRDGEEPLASIEALAAHHAAQIIASGYRSASLIVGYCAGGTVAFELARQLQVLGFPPCPVVLVGAPHSGWYRTVPQVLAHLREFARRVRRRILLKRRRKRELRPAPTDGISIDLAVRRRRIETATLAAAAAYRPRHAPLPLCIVLPDEYVYQSEAALLEWKQFGGETRVLRTGPGTSNDSMMLEDAAPALGPQLLALIGDAAAT